MYLSEGQNHEVDIWESGSKGENDVWTYVPHVKMGIFAIFLNSVW